MNNKQIDVLDYTIHFRSLYKDGIIGELFHIVRKEHGGSLLTPVGHIYGFIEPASLYSESFWKIIIDIREEVRYQIDSQLTHVFVKSAYKNKLKFTLTKLFESESKIKRINPQFPEVLKDKLIESGYCVSPISIQKTIGQKSYVYSNVKFNFDFD
ncbi:hypothetical protein AAU57_13755 [Nonlabens sp. YIK11]|uniref:hypothetical protein n=1 Tax=Nonlabens sp. YIK11 TaxID=1453349 RepID=UPI0006DCFE3E|nr:hypothetical protein [Nonlabens sp. YIK11]KQC34283.1 hypothetical protein AAU57_13755 [Nonlabens sp. YIK11]